MSNQEHSLQNGHNYHILTAEEIRRRKNVKRGIQFCIFVLGEAGTGKSTFLNNLCNRDVFSTSKEDKVSEPSDDHLISDLEILSHQVQLQEDNSTPITLNIVLAPGLGDNIDNTNGPSQVVNYLKAQFDNILNEEVRIKRSKRTTDTRPHVCLYFIRATSKGLREFDIQLMQELCPMVNIVPIISKADMLTDDELKLNKKLIMTDIKANHIKIYDFGDDKLEDTLVMSEDRSNSDSEIEMPAKTVENKSGNGIAFYSIANTTTTPAVDSYTKIKDMLPFAVISSNNKKTYPDGEVYHFRKYPWGEVTVEDRNSSDFIYLKSILLGSHLQDFKESTHNVLYENYRTNKLLANNAIPGSSECTNDNEHHKSYALAESFMSSMPGTDIGTSKSEADVQRVTSNYSEKNSNPPSQGTTVKEQLVLRELEEKDKLIENYQKKLEDLQQLLRDVQTNSQGSFLQAKGIPSS